jgi:hypothetical protein
MTELIYEENKSVLEGSYSKWIINIMLIYSLLIVGSAALLNDDVLTRSLMKFANTVQPVIHSSIINHDPVGVKMPIIPIGPDWNGSGSNTPQYIEMSELLLYGVNQYSIQ